MEQKNGSAFSKRVKRHVAASSHLFFATAAPGLSRLCLKELESIVTGPVSPRMVSGGIVFEGRLIDCYAANLHLRTANRILMRLASFTATNFRQLEKNLSQLPWELYLFPGSRLRFSVTARHSRLFHTEAVSQKIRKCIADRWSGAGTGPPAGQNIESDQRVYIRAVDDRMTLSIDSSGAHLHKRGLKTLPGPAPIRETLAAAVLKWAEYHPGIPLFDPMCGSGTFSLEAALIAKQIPAGYYRSFAFMAWPAFRPKQWQYLKSTSEKRFRTIAQPSIFASDNTPQTVRRVEQWAVAYGVSDAVNISCEDFFSMSPRDRVDRAGLVVLNPPYGHRIGNRNESRRLYAAITDKLAADFSGWTCALIVPAQQPITERFVDAKSYPFDHGGRKLRVLIGKIP